MSYDYTTKREEIFSDRGQRLFLKIRDQSKRLLLNGQTATMEQLIRSTGTDTWQMMACVDRLVELNEIYEVGQVEPVAGHLRTFRAL